MESAKGTFFETGSAAPTVALRELLKALAIELGKLPNKISIEGHTDAMTYVGQRYDNWDLSSDRANEARKLMQGEGIRSEQIAQVRGFADRAPRHGINPEDPSNRRVSLIVQYQVVNASEVALPGAVTSQNASPPGKEKGPPATAPGPGRGGD
jgi:chemotaxis protein MotB